MFIKGGKSLFMQCFIMTYIFFIKSCLRARVISSTCSGAGNGLINMNDLQCTGNEEHLLNCTYTSVNCTVAE